jgi:AcrR family transcriptional regulator
MRVTDEQNVKVDRRVQRTRQLLRDALIALILEKGYDEVLIQDITDRANLSRATFYLHFRDKEDLLMYGLRSVFDGLAEQLGPLSKDDLTWNGAPPSQIAFEHAGENRDLYRVMLKARSAGIISEHLREYLANRIRQHVEDVLPPEKLIVPMEVLCQHMAASLFGLIVWWLEQDTPYTAEQMAQMYHNLNAAAFLYISSQQQTR